MREVFRLGFRRNDEEDVMGNKGVPPDMELLAAAVLRSIRKMLTHSSFNRVVRDVAQKLGLTVESMAQGYITKLTNPNTEQSRFIHGVKLPVNSHASAALCADKAATADILASLHIPHVPHTLVFTRPSLPLQGSWRPLLDALDSSNGAGIVVKETKGGSGRHVYHIRNVLELETVWRVLMGAEKCSSRSLVYCPFVQLDSKEYRVVTLFGEPRYCYEKLRNDKEWKHNLAVSSNGSQQSTNIDPAVLSLGATAAKALDIAFAAVDVVKCSKSGELLVMEVNSCMGTKIYLSQHPEEREALTSIYADAIESVFRK